MFPSFPPPIPLLLLPLLFIHFSSSSSSPSSILVPTSYGSLEGFTHILGNGKIMDVFLGVPYAQPPIGELRFEKPLPPPHNWEGVRAAKRHGPACVPHARPADLEPIWNGTDQISEDCLFLNIFAPHQQEEATNSSSPKLHPILFVIHGGAFEVGSSRVYDFGEMGERFVARGIVVITVQYRLGVLGFASTGDKVMPGNLGLWDLVQALRWVHSEVAHFGGDARRITAQGYSAGGAAVSAMAMSPYGRSLFNQAIQMSGSMLAPTKSGAFVANETRRLAGALGCPASIDDSLALRQCLRAKSVDQIHEAVAKIGPSRSDVNFAKFASREDGHFFPRDLIELIHESPPKRTMMGHCRMDSLAYTLLQSKNDSVTQYAVPRHRFDNFGQSDFEHFVRQVVAKKEYFGTKAAKVQAEIIDFFTRKFKVPSKRDSHFYLERYSMVLSDLHYVMPSVWESRLKANWGWSLFLYEFVWTKPALFPEFVQIREAFHSLDHNLLFGGGQPFESANEHSAVGRMLVDAVANFVLSGNPSTDEVLWLPANSADPMRHLVIDGPRPRMKQQFEGMERLKFWHQLTERHKAFNLIKGTFGPKGEGHDEL